MRKIVAVLLLIFLLACFTACDKEQEQQTNPKYIRVLGENHFEFIADKDYEGIEVTAEIDGIDPNGIQYPRVSVYYEYVEHKSSHDGEAYSWVWKGDKVRIYVYVKLGETLKSIRIESDSDPEIYYEYSFNG